MINRFFIVLKIGKVNQNHYPMKIPLKYHKLCIDHSSDCLYINFKKNSPSITVYSGVLLMLVAIFANNKIYQNSFFFLSKFFEILDAFHLQVIADIICRFFFAKRMFAKKTTKNPPPPKKKHPKKHTCINVKKLGLTV